MQIMGDSQGDVVCIGSRECSVQRRYQKIIEEAPAFIVYNKALEQKMVCVITIERNNLYHRI